MSLLTYVCATVQVDMVTRNEQTHSVYCQKSDTSVDCTRDTEVVGGSSTRPQSDCFAMCCSQSLSIVSLCGDFVVCFLDGLRKCSDDSVYPARVWCHRTVGGRRHQNIRSQQYRSVYLKLIFSFVEYNI